MYHRKTEQVTVIISVLDPHKGEEFANKSPRLTEEIGHALHSNEINTIFQYFLTVTPVSQSLNQTLT